MSLRPLLPFLASLLLLAAARAGAAPAGTTARSGRIVVQTRQVVGKRAAATTTELWFTRTASRLTTRQGSAPAVVQVFDGKTIYRWRSGDRMGQSWHPAGMKVVPDVLSTVLPSGSLPGRKRVGSSRVAGVSCAVYEAKGVAPPSGAAWWRGKLTVQAWISRESRFPYVMRSRSVDAAGSRLESEVTLLRLDVPVSASLFRPPAKVQFLPPAQILGGRQVAGGLRPVAARVGIYLADSLGTVEFAPGRRIVAFEGARLALDRSPLATDRDVQEVRREPYGGAGPRGEALCLYLKSKASARVAQAAGAARGRVLVVLLDGQPVAAERIAAPWAAENNRIPIFASRGHSLDRMAERLRGSPVPPERRR